MNKIIESLKNHRSIRLYSDRKIDNSQLNAIIETAQAAPSSIGGQQVTIIAIENKETQKTIANYAGQKYIADVPLFLLFCADFYRAGIAAEINGREMEIQKSIESVMVGSVDVGISLGFAMAAAESMGLGTVVIGSIRKHPVEIAELIELPELVFPVAGLLIGHPSDWSRLKPRLPQDAVFHREKYNKDLNEMIEKYDKDFYGYVDQRGGTPHTWSSKIAATYESIYYPEVRKMLEKQGFGFE